VASNLSTIGFVFADGDEFTSAMVRLAGEARERLAVEGGEYAVWGSRTGAQIWFQFSPGDDAEIIGLTPFFEGVSDIPVKVTATMSRPEDTALEGAFTGWVAPDERAEDAEGAYPIVFEAVDFGAQRSRTLPAVCNIRLSGFARQVTAFASADAYYAQHNPQPTFAAQSFVPMGMFAAAIDEDGSEPLPPSSAAMLTGEVVEHSRLTNEATGRPFHWLLVKSAEATFDILADPDVVTGDIAVGGTVDVVCQMFGRFLD
jgi:hypothetical protein